MPDVDLPFTHAEYAARLNQTRAEMEARGIAVLFVTDPSNMSWLTGYDGWSFYTHQGVLIGPAGTPLYWGRAMNAVGATKTTYLPPDDIIGYPDDYVMSEAQHPMDHLAALIADRGWADLPLGVEMENYYYSARAHAVLTAKLPRPTVDATALVNRCRAVKSDQELIYMRRAARIVERIHDCIYDRFAPGIPKNQIVAEIYHTAITGAFEDGVAFGGDYPAIAPLLPTGKEAAAAHLTWNDAPVPANSGTFFEVAGCHRRYHCPVARTIWLGTPPDDLRRAEDAILEGTAAGIDAARPGNTAGDVARAFYAVLARHGIAREGRCGYPIGLSYPPDWGERTFSIRPSDETPLLPNMTFHFMPGLWTSDWGLEITETLRIRRHGPAEPLAEVPRKLMVKP